MPPSSERVLTPAKHGPARAGAVDLWLLRVLAAALQAGRLSIVLWDGSAAGAKTDLRIHIRDRAALWQVARDPELHFGDLYSQGRIEVEGDLTTLIERIYAALASTAYERSVPWLARWRHGGRTAPTLDAARRNVSHHYDLGNDFYALWLDAAAMQYTCAYFPEPGMSLEAAQRAKMDHVCRKLRLRPGQRVFEAGCGWGGLALHMAREYGVRVRAWNISREQIRHAREKARAAGLQERVEYVEDDYRSIRGECDAFVSVGMLEHVGPGNYRALGETIDRCLAPNGLGLLHSIGRNRPMPMNGWIAQRIFPGARPPALSEMMAVFEPFDFSVLDVENLRLHYAETLRHWLARYLAAVDHVRATHGVEFSRAWHLYLAGSTAAFTTGRMQLFQVVFARGGNNALPATRRELYA